MTQANNDETNIDYQRKIFSGFMTWTKWVVIVVFVILIWMAIFIS
ncbi:MAG: aa3-type cytochrome c oxidase subunit IV [Aestuariivita sp.]|nr:aa3-type cytochrome c oxidase subunit IV [Aestuariivita sp.]MCY4201752.1 aa3-type cytochrome c oxidase subunit IV [Aestuariivita sp.]MCY4289424.1 aa3-type cytochrome c oxidase subunit IV [Aestuariivita sp.]MCY4346649.1 aa3-type cytochrome c oxidase subunit IV [Aestuariivita sp.]